jgi:hypothetical protein
MTKIILPERDSDKNKARHHLSCYYDGYINGNHQSVEKFAEILKGGRLYPRISEIEQAASRVLLSKLCAPYEVIGYCFNQAGLEDKQCKMPQRHGQWIECLTDIAKNSAMAYSEQEDNLTATIYVLNQFKRIDDEEADFSKGLFCLWNDYSSAFIEYSHSALHR